ncbi:MAG: lysylphosphatidylglycerol synthase domain-containing protein [Arcicella sp.]|nr:lysylphosphatidylglycerol synthase domain-containing protein [Arcicella sp.]
MQNTQESNLKASFLSEKLLPIFKWVIFGLIMWFSYQSLKKEITKIDELYFLLEKAINYENAIKIGLLLTFIFINWGLEAKKWQILASKIEKISFIEAYQSVLIGLSLGFSTPANLGDYAGKIWTLKSKNKTEIVGAIILGNGIQFYVSLIFGAIGYSMVWNKKITTFDQIIYCLVAFLLILGICAYIFRRKLIGYLPKRSWLKKFHNHFEIIIKFDSNEMQLLFLWSILRYVTFSLQFVLMLLVFKINIHFIDLWAVSCLIFLYKTLMPAINFVSDLGVREYSALHFFSLFAVKTSLIIVSTFCLWFLNILIPVMVGGLLVLRIKNK